MSRHTTFRYRLDPTVEQAELLSRHAGAARFAFNQCLAMVKSGLARRRRDPAEPVPWTRFDLINAFNKWKMSEAAGRVFAVASDGTSEIIVTGLAWRREVSQQVFEEAASDCGRALAAFADSRRGRRRGKRIGFPRFKSKKATVASFRLRNKNAKGGRPAIRVGDNGVPRSVTVPGIGVIRVGEDTRRLRRMVTAGRAKILSVTVIRRGGGWWICVACAAADLHQRQRYPGVSGAEWIGVDRGLTAFVVAATANGAEVMRIDAPRPHIAGLLRNTRSARAISDAGWSEFARLLTYKLQWRGGELVIADRWFPSSKRCSACGAVKPDLLLRDRVFVCGCGFRADRDFNAAVNLALWQVSQEDRSRSPDLSARGRVTKARRREGAGRHPLGGGGTGSCEAGTDARIGSNTG